MMTIKNRKKNIPVKLNRYELFSSAMVGVKRHLEALMKGLPDKHGFDGESGWTIHIEGAAGEQAFAKATNRYYSGSVNTFKVGGDVGNIQIRTRSRLDYDLIVRDNDRDEDIFVLVVGKAPEFKVVGWIRGADAKQEKYIKRYGNRPPAYFVLQEDLKGFKI